MKVMVIGSGGREHALAWKIAQNKEISRVYVAPGNAGTALNADMVNVPISSVPDLLDFAQKEQINLTIVGPEAPLSQGVVDAFRAAGLKIFGPTKAAAQLEADVKNGANGLKIYKSLGMSEKDINGKRISVDDSRLDPIWKKAGELKIPVLIVNI